MDGDKTENTEVIQGEVSAEQIIAVKPDAPPAAEVLVDVPVAECFHAQTPDNLTEIRDIVAKHGLEEPLVIMEPYDSDPPALIALFRDGRCVALFKSDALPLEQQVLDGWKHHARGPHG